MGKSKVARVLHEFKHGTLRSGSKSGPKVKSRAQAIAIGLSEARKAGESVAAKPAQSQAEPKRQHYEMAQATGKGQYTTGTHVKHTKKHVAQAPHEGPAGDQGGLPERNPETGIS